MASLVCRWVTAAKEVTCLLIYSQEKRPRGMLCAVYLSGLGLQSLNQSCGLCKSVLTCSRDEVSPHLDHVTVTVGETWFPNEHVGAVKKGETME